MANKWQINQAIVCINDSNCDAPIKKGLKYIINDIRICPTCGMMEFKLSIPFEGKCQECVTCRTPLEVEHLDTWWSEHWRFAPLETMTNKDKNVNFKIQLEPNKIIKELEIYSN